MSPPVPPTSPDPLEDWQLSVMRIDTHADATDMAMIITYPRRSRSSVPRVPSMATFGSVQTTLPRPMR